MNEQIDRWLDVPAVETLAYFSVAILALILCLSLFEWATKYKDWEEIKNGNVAVAMALGGKMFGICNIFRYAVGSAKDSVYEAFLWAGYGFVLLLVAYFIFEFLTPFFKIDEEIARDNRAVGFLSMMLSASLSFVIGASIQ